MYASNSWGKKKLPKVLLEEPVILGAFLSTHYPKGHLFSFQFFFLAHDMFSPKWCVTYRKAVFLCGNSCIGYTNADPVMLTHTHTKRSGFQAVKHSSSFSLSQSNNISRKNAEDWLPCLAHRLQHSNRGRESSEGRAPKWKARRNTNMGSSPWCGKGFFSQSPSSANSFRASVQPTCVQSHASRSVCTLKIPNTGSHTTVLDTWKYHTDWQERVVLLLQLLCLTQVRWPKFSAKDKEVLKN